MKKAALLIAILSLVVATLAANQMRVVDSYAASLKPSLADSIQKPKGDELTEEFHQLYPLSPTGRVSISNINGGVHINVWDQGSVKVDAVKRAYSQQRLSELTIDVTNTTESVRIKTKYPEDRNNGRRGDRCNAIKQFSGGFRAPKGRPGRTLPRDAGESTRPRLARAPTCAIRAADS